MDRHELLVEGERALSLSGIHNARQEAGWILEHVLCRQDSGAASAAAGSFSVADAQRFRDLLGRRVKGEPLQYVLGTTEFYGLELWVGPGVLIPRPETERLVDFALEAYTGGIVCDVCTGSGAVALALAVELGAATQVVGLDISAEALGYAEKNRRSLGLENVGWVQADLLSTFRARCDLGLITANPPYVSPRAYEQLPPEVADYEPRLALYAADRGLSVIRKLLAGCLCLLRPGGVFLCEISSEQGRAALDASRAAGYHEVSILKDYTGRDRILRARTQPQHSA